MTFHVGGIHHVTIVVNDLDAARRFYGDGLGLDEIDRPDFEAQGFWLQLGAQQLHVSQGDEAAPSRNHIALSVEGLDNAVAHLEAQGNPVRRGRDIVGAGRQAFLRDPWGNLIELNEQ
ncbi:MAG: VOC family protein [Acidimicrobiales bacterium]|nr:VOC family protein [Acidimicrobiales bacterium]